MPRTPQGWGLCDPLIMVPEPCRRGRHRATQARVFGVLGPQLRHAQEREVRLAAMAVLMAGHPPPIPETSQDGNTTASVRIRGLSAIRGYQLRRQQAGATIVVA